MESVTTQAATSEPAKASTHNAPLLLASASPRRAELLRQIGLQFVVRAADIDETIRPGELPLAYAQRMALEKGAALVGQVIQPWVLSADTVVVVDDEILLKPADREDARRMLGRLSGRSHQVISALALHGEQGCRADFQISEVSFCALSDADIDTYLATGEADDKAGAYGIQGRAATFISGLQGSYSGVMGLPIFETCRLLGAERVRQWQVAAEAL